ncbi:MAG TPA: class A beta-lactamase [Caulobacteraceae bacterium]
MHATRRLLVTALAAGLADCGRPARRGVQPSPLDTRLLDRRFPAIAERARPGVFNAGVIGLGANRSWYWNINRAFPMESVAKAPIAAAALAEVDAGRLSLHEPIALTADDLSAPFSAINQAWPTPPEGHALTLTAGKLISLAVRLSDNTAADVIMKRIGGPGAVTAWLQSKQIVDMRVDRYAREVQQAIAGMASFRSAWKGESAWLAARGTVAAVDRQAAMDAYLTDPRDTTTAQAALNFLSKLADGELLSRASTRLLIGLMTGGPTGAGRLGAGLPAGAVLAHKTGSTDTDLGFTPVTNDIGIVTLPDGRRFAAAAFLAGATATLAERDRLFADTARLMVRAFG